MRPFRQPGTVGFYGHDRARSFLSGLASGGPRDLLTRNQVVPRLFNNDQTDSRSMIRHQVSIFGLFHSCGIDNGAVQSQNVYCNDTFLFPILYSKGSSSKATK